MLVKIGKQNVDVLELACARRDCFALGFDKGSFTPGVGYTNYHKDSKGKRIEKPVCSTRQYRGCPSNSVCPPVQARPGRPGWSTVPRARLRGSDHGAGGGWCLTSSP